jgi:hypothetical protein
MLAARRGIPACMQRLQQNCRHRLGRMLSQRLQPLGRSTRGSGWLPANLSAAKQDPVGWLRLPTFHFQGPARRSFPKQISQFVASAVRAAIAVDLLRSSTANQPGDFADMPRELRQPSTWPYAAHTHSLISRSTSSTRALPKCSLPTLIAGAARTLAADRAR